MYPIGYVKLLIIMLEGTNLRNMEIKIDCSHRSHWINAIAPYTLKVKKVDKINLKPTIYLLNIDNINQLEPFHFVLLACLREQLKRIGYDECYLRADSDVTNYLLNVCNLGKYWIGELPVDYMQSKDQSVFNLWRVKKENIEPYSEAIHQYLKQNFFHQKDLSSLKLALLETFYNIFDHADAKGNAFSFIKFEEVSQKLHIAVCDFGVGIAYTIRNTYPEIENDAEAVRKATEDTITASSQPHNKGMGLGNIISNLDAEDIFRIVSNKGLLKLSGGKMETFEFSREFKGTLIYYEITLSQFEDEEIVSTFDF